MSTINFTDIIDLLKSLDNSEVKESVRHDDGVFRRSVIYISPYTVTIEYIEFSNSHIPLTFTALKDGSDKPIHFRSVENLMDTLGISDSNVENTK